MKLGIQRKSTRTIEATKHSSAKDNARMNGSRLLPFRLFSPATLLGLALACAAVAHSQTCLTADDMDQPTVAALQNAAKRYYDMAAHADAATLKQNAIPSLAGNFSGVENAIKENQADLSTSQPAPRSPFLLKVEGNAPLEKAEFLCGVFGAKGQTSTSAEFVIPNMAPGNYAVVTVDASGAKEPRTVTFVLEQQGSEWKLGGFYVRNSLIAGHDEKWFTDKARAFKEKGQKRNAWFYYLAARDLLVPVTFMYTQATDRLYDEMQAVKPTDLPPEAAVELTAAGKTYKLTDLFPFPEGKDFDLVVRYQSADVSNSAKTFQENTEVMKALLAKYPEFRDGFDGMVARAVEPSGRDYGSMLAMKDIK